MSLYKIGSLILRRHNPIFVTSIAGQHSVFSSHKIIQTFNNNSFNSGNIKRISTTIWCLKDKDRGKSKKRDQTGKKKIDITELEKITDFTKLLEEFQSAIEHLKQDLINHTSLRTTVGSLENLLIKHKNGKHKLQEIARISRKPKEVILDMSTSIEAVPGVLETLRSAEMRLNPRVDGHTIYIPIPKVTKEYREILSKSAKSICDKHVRHIKTIRDTNVRDINAQDNLPIDMKRRVEANLDLLCKQYVQKAEELLDQKKGELLNNNS